MSELPFRYPAHRESSNLWVRVLSQLRGGHGLGHVAHASSRNRVELAVRLVPWRHILLGWENMTPVVRHTRWSGPIGAWNRNPDDVRSARCLLRLTLRRLRLRGDAEEGSICRC